MYNKIKILNEFVNEEGNQEEKAWKEVKGAKGIIALHEVTRVEIIDDTGRAYYNWNKANKVEMSLQDNGRTLKIFVYGIGIKEID